MFLPAGVTLPGFCPLLISSVAKHSGPFPCRIRNRATSDLLAETLCELHEAQFLGWMPGDPAFTL